MGQHICYNGKNEAKKGGEDVRRILYGTDFVENRMCALREIRDMAAQERGGLLLIVPENQSHEAERQLCTVCGNRISRYAEVLSLPRLAGRLFSAAGGVAATAFDRGGKLLAMSRACRQLHSRIKVFASRTAGAEHLLSLVDLCDELESACVAPDDLRAAAREMTGALAQKIEEIADIFDVYAGLCRGHESALTRLRDLLDEQPELVAEKHVWIDGFTYLTRQERAIALALARTCADFTLVLTGEPEPGRDRVFGAVREFAADFRTIDAVWRRIEPAEGRGSAALRHAQEQLFSAGTEVFSGEQDALRVARAGSVRGECLACADAALSLVRSGRARWRDIHIAYTDAARYRPALQSVLARYGVPAYFAGSEPIENQSVAAFVLTALDSVSGGMEYEDVLRHLKTGFSPITRDECDQLENYAYTWDIRGAAWLRAWTKPPDGAGAQMDARAERELAALNEIRARALAPLGALQSGLREARSIRGQIAALCRYFDDVRLCDRLEARAAERAGTQEAMTLSQLYDILCAALDAMDDILGEESGSPEEFARLMRLLLTQYAVSTITPSLDAVQAGSAESLYRSPCRHLFVLGAEEGMLPAAPARRGPLSDGDRDALRRRGVPILSGTEHDLDFSLASVWHLLGTPSDSLCLSWCAQGETAPSFLIGRLCAVFLSLRIEEYPAYPSILLTDAASAGALCLRAKDDAALACAVAEHSLFAEPEVQRAAQEWDKRAAYRLPPLSGEAVRRLYGEKLYLSASRVDQLASCRCAYFLRYGLRAKPRRQASFDAPLFGTLVHEVLENTAARAMDEGGFAAVRPERLRQIAEQEMTETTARQLGSLDGADERFRYLFERNRREVRRIVDVLGREMAKSDFQPVRFEMAFADGGELPPVSIGDDAQISGFVDRVDLFSSNGTLYVRVIDYKTGRKSFDYTDILSGIGLQMLIYLFTLCDLGETVFGCAPEPAGVLYVPAREAIVPVGRRPDAEEADAAHASERTRKGLVLDDESVVCAMERTDGTPEFLPLKRKKDGSLTGDLASREQFGLLKKFTMARLRACVDEIASGDVTPDPYTRGSAQGACAYCEFAQVCHLDTYPNAVRRLASTDRALFWEKVEKEVGDDG